MNFKRHSRLEGQHAFLSASNYHWINYDELKLETTFIKQLSVQRGTRLHELSHNCIELEVRMPKNKQTLNMYVNDAIGFRMKPEQLLYFSDNCFGTADAISFKDNLLRIHDLKTGSSKASIKQLEVYAALFCLEYNKSPNDINIELRIYQSDSVLVHVPLPEDILYIMNKIITFDKKIEKLKSEV
jgi:hypothetical protein